MANPAVVTPTADIDAKLRALGAVVDIDSHEMIPVYLWRESFGEQVWSEIAELVPGWVDQFGADVIGPLEPPDDLAAARSAGQGATAADSAVIDPATIWAVKGPTAPGAIDMTR